MAKATPGISDFYQDNSKLKWIVLVVSILISVGSIYYTNILVNQLKEREKQQIELYAKALAYTINDESNQNFFFITEEILYKNNSIPIIWITNDGQYEYRNIELNENWTEERKKKILDKELMEMKELYEPIKMTSLDESGEIENYGNLYYKNSFLLTLLISYPYIQLLVIAIFGFISYLAFNYSKAAEQNRVWVGLAKETAHQLGTPLSSLMAWMEVLRDDPILKERGIADELQKDIHKLNIVTERFSSIGSAPTLKPENVVLAY